MNRVSFFIESMKNISTTGTITRTSKFVSKKMISHIDFSTAKTIVELGAGDGVITKHILKNMNADCKLICFEINEKFIEILKTIKDDRLLLMQSAENLKTTLSGHDIEEIDAIISALPMTSLPDELVENIVNNSNDSLKVGGKFIQIHYMKSAKKLYEKVFKNVRVKFYPWNVPPAFVMIGEKQ